ncbi:MAG: hypothetical protein WCD04_12690 [Terriglobia bacterium]|jgi:hypothetical protein
MDANERVRAFQRGLACAVAVMVLVLDQGTGSAQMPGQALPNLPQIRVEQNAHGLRANDPDGSFHYQIAMLYKRIGDESAAREALNQSEALRKNRERRAQETIQAVE